MNHFARRSSSAWFLIALAWLLVRPVVGQDLEAIAYQMPAGWYNQPVQAGPELLAHYVYMSGGRPYGELYLSREIQAAPKSLDELLREGIEKARPGLQGYSARGTQRTTIGGLEALVHDFSYFVAGSVAFSGRVYVLVSDNIMYSFLFNTPTQTFSFMQGVFGQVMATVRPTPRPKPDPNIGGGGGAGTARPGAGLTVEEEGLVLDLPGGWIPSNDPAGAKYRLYDANGSLLLSLFVFKPDQTDGIMALFGQQEGLLKSALQKRRDELFKNFKRYDPGPETQLKVAGFNALLHDFGFEMETRTRGFYRWLLIEVKTQEDTAQTRYAPTVRQFAFMSAVPDRWEALKPQLDAIIRSMRLKGQPALALTPGEPPPGKIPETKTPPAKPAGALPTLEDAPPADSLKADPWGRFEVVLPAGAKLVHSERSVFTYRMPKENTDFTIHCLRTNPEVSQAIEPDTAGKRQSGTEMTWDVGPAQASISLWTGRNEAGVNMAAVVANYAGKGLVIIIRLPAADYGAAQDWISTLIRSVRFL